MNRILLELRRRPGRRATRVWPVQPPETGVRRPVANSELPLVLEGPMVALLLLLVVVSRGSTPAAATATISVDWSSVLASTHAVPTVHTPNSYAWQRVTPSTGQPNPMHDVLYSRLKTLGTDHIRYMQAQDGNGLSNISAYPEPYPPDEVKRTTSWQLGSGASIDEFVVDFCAATKNGDCSDTVIFIGPLPPWFFRPSPNSTAVCNATDSQACTGPMIDPSGVAAGEYYSRIVSWYTKGYMIDEFGKRIEGGHHFNFTYWEVLNEPNLYAHYRLPPGAVVDYTRVYDGITRVLHRDHPSLRFAAMCWGGIPVQEVQYFMNASNHDPVVVQGSAWPPAFLTFHIYNGPGTKYGLAAPPGLSATTVADAKAVVDFVRTSSGGRTKSFVDEMGIFGCPAINFTTVLEGQAGRFEFHNSRAAWFAASYGQLASLGVDAMGSSQFFGYDGITGEAHDWPHGSGAGPQGFWYYPCLSALDWDTGLPNARYYTIKMLVDELGGSQLKAVSPATVTQPPPPLPPPPPPSPPPSPPRTSCKEVKTVSQMDYVGGDICEYNMTMSATSPGAAALAECATTCCAHAKCQNYVVVAPSSAWPGAGQCQSKPACFTGGVCCYLKDASSVATPRPGDTTYAAGSVTPSAFHPPPPPPPLPPSNKLLAFGFTLSGGEQRLLLVNTGELVLSDVTVAPAGKGMTGATHTFVDENHGHGEVQPGREMVGADGKITVGAFGVSVISLL